MFGIVIMMVLSHIIALIIIYINAIYFWSLNIGNILVHAYLFSNNYQLLFELVPDGYFTRGYEA